MDVNSTMIDAVMNPKQRAEFLPEYRTQLARRNVLNRQQSRLRAEILDNERRVTTLELLSGGLKNGDPSFLHHKYEANAVLQKDWTRNDDTHPKDYAVVFRGRMNSHRPYTEEDMDKYAVNIVELEAYSGYSDAASFWMHAIYGGDYKLMIDQEAEGLGFERKLK